MKKGISLAMDMLQMALGVLLASIGLKAFLLPNGFLDGGVTGIAILVSGLSGLDISWLLVAISIPFLLLGRITLSTENLLKSVVSIIALAVVIHYENFSPVTEDKLLIAIFGGLFLGAGIGLTIRNGAVLDGSEILGIFVNERFGVSIGKVILFFNVILFSVTAFVISTEVAMYSVLTYLVTAKVIDLIIEGFEDHAGLMIVSRKALELENELQEKLSTGITVYKGVRGHGSTGKQEDMDILHLVVNRIDIKRTNKIIDQVDPTAFIIEFDVNDVRGGIQRRILSTSKRRKMALQ